MNWLQNEIAKWEKNRNELDELKYSKSLIQLTSYAHWHTFLYLHAQTELIELNEHIFLCKKSLKNHNSKWKIIIKFACKPSQLYPRVQSLDREPKLSKKNGNHVSLEYVKQSKTDFDFFPDYIIKLIDKIIWSHQDRKAAVLL